LTVCYGMMPDRRAFDAEKLVRPAGSRAAGFSLRDATDLYVWQRLRVAPVTCGTGFQPVYGGTTIQPVRVAQANSL
jgi:hypothetical protein